MAKAEHFLQAYMMHRGVLSDLIAGLKDEDLSYTPWEGALSTRDLIWHMLSTSYSFTNAAATGTFERVTDKPALETVSDVQKAIQEYTDKTVALINSMSDERFGEMVDMTRLFGREVPASVLLQTMRDHEIHHKGQLFTYVRLCGVEKVPMFVKIR